ncbi:MAG: hypothetical protein OXE84_05240 [Rhodobacteraceae bacterium]|nr:hypothetical protein [Paracoccaceae bacterium]MCY4197189.1 hypothetical protein [Paracoccaceae bacterium]MCY4327577.1 hypothetical protein [Paracoccaceae bacterium]
MTGPDCRWKPTREVTQLRSNQWRRLNEVDVYARLVAGMLREVFDDGT